MAHTKGQPTEEQKVIRPESTGKLQPGTGAQRVLVNRLASRREGTSTVLFSLLATKHPAELPPKPVLLAAARVLVLPVLLALEVDHHDRDVVGRLALEGHVCEARGHLRGGENG